MTSLRIYYDIRLAKFSDFQEIVEHLCKHFLRDSPISNYFHYWSPPYDDFENSVMKSMDNSSQNLVAIHDGKIVGVSMNEIQDKNEEETLYRVEFKDDRVKVNVEFMKFCTREAKLFDKYPDCKKSFLVNYLSVDSAYRGRGIAKALVNKCLEVAKQFGCDVITANCASEYAAQLFERLEYEKIFEQVYEDYQVKGDYKVDDEFRENGRIVIRPKEPHRKLKVYARRVD